MYFSLVVFSVYSAIIWATCITFCLDPELRKGLDEFSVKISGFYCIFVLYLQYHFIELILAALPGADSLVTLYYVAMLIRAAYYYSVDDIPTMIFLFPPEGLRLQNDTDTFRNDDLNTPSLTLKELKDLRASYISSQDDKKLREIGNIVKTYLDKETNKGKEHEIPKEMRRLIQRMFHPDLYRYKKFSEDDTKLYEAIIQLATHGKGGRKTRRRLRKKCVPLYV